MGALPPGASRAPGRPFRGPPRPGLPWTSVSQSAGSSRRRPPDDPAVLAGRVGDVVQQLRSDFSARDRLYRGIENVLWSDYDLNVPDAYRETTLDVNSPLQLNIAQTIAAALSVNPAQVHFRPVGRSQNAQLNAELRQD